MKVSIKRVLLESHLASANWINLKLRLYARLGERSAVHDVYTELNWM